MNCKFLKQLCLGRQSYSNNFLHSISWTNRIRIMYVLFMAIFFVYLMILKKPSIFLGRCPYFRRNPWAFWQFRQSTSPGERLGLIPARKVGGTRLRHRYLHHKGNLPWPAPFQTCRHQMCSPLVQRASHGVQAE